MIRITDFIEYLNAQIGSAYVWGAQGHIIDFTSGAVTRNGKLISSNYVKWVKSAETSSVNAERALNFISKRRATGITTLSAFDCSGLGVSYLYDQKKWIKGDMSAASIYKSCTKITRADLRAGDMVFREDEKGKVHHIGYVTKVENGEVTVVESYGRDVGVVSRDINASSVGYWNKYGRFPLLQEVDPEPVIETPFYAVCDGGKVNVRSSASVSNNVIGRLVKGDLMLAMPSKNGWCAVVAFVNSKAIVGYMSDKYVKKRT